jgi:crotonobetaine/carnitine-CoA ligase
VSRRGLDGEPVLARLLAGAGERYGDRPYLSFALDERACTFAEAADAAARLAGGLAGLGVEPGDRVLLMLRNRLELALGWLGAATLGAVQVPVNVDYRGAFLEHLAATAGARLLVVETDLLDAVEASLPRLPELRTVVVVGEPRPLGDRRVVPFAELLGAAPRPPHGGHVSDPAAVHFTSGTSGVAKGAVVPNGAMHLLCTRNRELLGLGPESVYLTELPLFHINAQMTVYAGLLTGGRARIERRFSATAWLERVRTSGATHTSLLGVMLGFILAQPERPDDADNPLSVAWTVPYTVAAARAFRERFGVERVVTSYGSTELGMVARRGGPEDGAEGSAGRVDPDWYAVLVADERGEPVAAGEVGELLVRPTRPWTVAQEYVGMPRETIHAFRDLWFHTGDAVRLDEDGSLWFVDRYAERIRRRGENVASAEVERVLLEHPGVEDAAVVAVRADGAGGEDEIKAVLVGQADAEAIWAWCDERLPYFAVPRYVEFVDALPKTPTAKVRKTELREAGVGPSTSDRGAAPSGRGLR